MTSTFTVIPSQHLNGGRLGMPDQRPVTTQGDRPGTSSPAATLNRLSPSAHYGIGLTSPTFLDTNTSTGSTPDSIQYQPSDFSNSDVGDDFLGVNFGDANGGLPSFLGESLRSSLYDFTFDQPLTDHTFNPPPLVPSHSSTIHTYPLSPEPSLHTVSPPVQRRPSGDVLPPKSAVVVPQSQFTPDTSDSIPSSDDGIVPTMSHISAQSPRVTVSMWERDDNADDGTMDAKLMGFATSLDGNSGLGGVNLPVASHFEVSRDGAGKWMPDTVTGQGGLNPRSRSAAETPSPNDLAAARETQDKNSVVDSWLSATAETSSGSDGEGRPQSLYGVGVPDREIGLGCDTRNATKAGQTYFREDASGPMTQDDIQILLGNRVWGDSPAVLPIVEGATTPTQPKTAIEAVAKFEAACRDNDSIVSRAATWGTRRRSLPSVVDMEGIVSGNWVKKLSISHAEPKKPNNFLDELFKVVRRRPSAPGLANLKRSFTGQGDDDASSPTIERRESGDRLAPPSRSPSWGKRPVPSINTALVEMGNNFAAIGTTHARSGSISSTTPVVSPKSPFGLKVNTFRRRAKSDLPARPKGNSSVSNIAGMWMKAGGPPVANLANTVGVTDHEDDDDDDDDQDDGDMSSDGTKLIDDIAPNLAGFSEHILKLNPMLAEQNNYLVERIAYQQIARYKSLLTHKIKHMGSVQDGNCICGKLCIDMGGSAIALENKGAQDPWSARIHGSDEDLSTPLEGAIGQDSFPRDIPMPPTQTLPAEFECQLCFQSKKFQKPSDWTKHVHEDVQPFTCTWDRCREPKIFKRKADWVRHENEGHRHLEWWTCDVADCRHTCYRRDNFLQHLVREHKFQEPKVKTKAAIKRAGGLDRTWQKVESCHAETRARPQDEPCRFCGKTFPTWKKLTVHLAKHMEQISLPILRLVARKHLDADTIVSPVQEPPQRPFPAIPPAQDQQQTHLHAQRNLPPQQPAHLQMPGHQRHSPITYAVQQPQFPYGVTSPDTGGPFVSPQFHHTPAPSFNHGLSSLHSLDTTGVLGMPNVSPNPAYQTPHQASFLDLPVSANSFGGLTTPQRQFGLSVTTNGLEPFPQMPISSAPLHDSATALNFDCGLISAGAGMGGQFQARTSPYPQSADRQQAGGGNFYQ
ncbi:hypothetical protein PspLS_04890 [Pyricularia sp. CBS 133598]|nr:hypothetical protein PspLS_04890 [Pyricularia sp. CBS 133598]